MAHGDFGLGADATSFNMEMPVAGRVKDINITFNQDSFNQEGAIVVVLSTSDDDSSTKNYADLAEFITTTDFIANIHSKDPMFPFVILSGTDSEVRSRKKGAIDISAGELLFFKIFGHFTVDPTAGNLFITIRVELDVFALKSYGANMPNKNQNFVFGMIGGQLDSDKRYQLMFPADGLIGNFRLTIWRGWISDLESMTFTQRISDDDPVVDTIDMEAEDFGVKLIGSDATAVFIAQTSYSFQKVKVRKDRAMFLHLNNSSGEVTFTLEYSYIPEKKNLMTINDHQLFTDGDEADRLIVLPYDMYVWGLDFDWNINIDTINTLRIFVFKPPFDNNFNEADTVMGLFQLDAISGGQPNLLDVIIMAGTVGGGTLNSGSSMAAVKDYWPAGTVIYIHLVNDLGSTQSVVLDTRITAHSEMEGRWLGTNILEGEALLNQVNGEISE